MAYEAGIGPGGLPPRSEPPTALRPDGDPGVHTLQILTTEHWSLLSARSLGYTESMSRVSIFVASLSASVVALALVAQATSFGRGFNAFALVLLPVVYFLGVVTVVRLGQINTEDATWLQGMNRLRHAYLEIAPELERYFVTSRYDDDRGVVKSLLGVEQIRVPLQGFVAVPGVVAVLSSVVAGGIGAVGVLGLSDSTLAAFLVAGALFVVSLTGFSLLAVRTIAAARRRFEVHFPTPPSAVD